MIICCINPTITRCLATLMWMGTNGASKVREAGSGERWLLLTQLRKRVRVHVRYGNTIQLGIYTSGLPGGAAARRLPGSFYLTIEHILTSRATCIASPGVCEALDRSICCLAWALISVTAIPWEADTHTKTKEKQMHENPWQMQS